MLSTAAINETFTIKTPRDNTTYRLENSVEIHEVKFISSILNSSDDSGCEISLCPQRVAGVTIESSLHGKLRILTFADEMVPAEQRLKVNDLGAILVRAGL